MATKTTLLFILLFSNAALALDRCSHYISAGNKSFSSYDLARKMGATSGETICSLESGGSLENLYNLLKNERVLAGFIQSDVLAAASRKNSAKLRTLTLGIPVLREYAHVIVKNNSSMKALGDLENSVVCVGDEASGSYFTAQQIKAKAQVPWIDAVEKYDVCMGLLARGGVDAVFASATPPIKGLNEELGKSYRLIPVQNVRGYKQGKLTGYSSISANEFESVYSDTMLVLNDERIKQNIRLENKLSMGIAAVISSLPIKLRDKVCMKEYEQWGMASTFLHKPACSLGYYGEDW